MTRRLRFLERLTSDGRQRLVAGAVGAAVLGAGSGCSSQPPALSIPVLADPYGFEIQLVTDFSDVPGVTKPFQLTVTSERNGFQAGLYVTAPFSSDVSDRLLRVTEAGEVEVVADGFNTIETIVFATPEYGRGLLYTEPPEFRVGRLSDSKELATFASFDRGSWGPTFMTYGPDGLIYVNEGSTGRVVRLHPDGSAEEFARVPLPESRGVAVVKGGSVLAAALRERWGGQFVVGTFTWVDGDRELPRQDSIYVLSRDGDVVRRVVTGLSGLELMTFGPGGEFGEDLYVGTLGADVHGDGAVLRISADGRVEQFVSGVDAVSVAFDATGVLGGGMYLADMNNMPDVEGSTKRHSGRIWRVVPTRSADR